VNRVLFRQIAEERERDALGLINIGQWSGAYYLAGYAVECGLKACIARKTSQDDFPDKEFANKCFTHNIEELVKLAGLQSTHKALVLANPVFEKNWKVVREWDEKARYSLWTEAEARDLYRATTDLADGVLTWIKAYW
jgi:HEPN domain-containing protein